MKKYILKFKDSKKAFGEYKSKEEALKNLWSLPTTSISV